MAAISESGESAWDWSMAGRALAMNGENEEAMFYFRVANKIDPKDSMIHYYLGQAYQDLGDQYRALHHYTEALKDRPDFPEVYNNMAALSFNEDGDIKSAIQHLEEALQHDPDDRMKIAVYKSLAQLHHKLANYDQHEYYKGKLLEAIGFPVDWEEGDDEEEKGEV
ncbi:MAG: tetratricopeptide repeat protein [Bacteroidetes bacterium]|nr:tetratricopeptide repeat protein [Bacteroidota bacterium]